VGEVRAVARTHVRWILDDGRAGLAQVALDGVWIEAVAFGDLRDQRPIALDIRDDVHAALQQLADPDVQRIDRFARKRCGFVFEIVERPRNLCGLVVEPLVDHELAAAA
jgi:hypothetical protein